MAKQRHTSRRRGQPDLGAGRPTSREGDGLALLGKPKVLGSSVTPTSYGDDGRLGPGDNNDIFRRRYDQYRHKGGEEGRRLEERGRVHHYEGRENRTPGKK
jgi:hypothetical protein